MKTKTFLQMEDFGYSIPERVFLEVSNAEEKMKSVLTDFLGEYERKQAKWRECYAQVVEWLSDNKGKGLLLMGDCGTGKTLIGGRVVPCIINECARKSVTPFAATGLTDNKRLEYALSKKIVFIDDVGTEGWTNDYGNKRWAFSELVDNAERNGNLLIVTTNLNHEELKEKYGMRTFDRLKNITKCILFEGESFRGLKD